MYERIRGAPPSAALPPVTGLDTISLPADRHPVVVEICQKAQEPHVFVINAPTARSRSASDAVEVLSTAAPVLKTTIHQRQLFASSMNGGHTVGEIAP